MNACHACEPTHNRDVRERGSCSCSCHRPRRQPIVEGGIRVTSNTSMEPIRTLTIPLDVHVVASSINAGFQIGWLGCDDPPAEISAGAGMGSQYGTIKVGDTRLVFSAADLLAAVIEALNEEGTQP